MWLRHERALTRVIIEQGEGAHPTTCAALAHFVLEIRSMLHGEPRPAETIERIFALLEEGWEAVEPAHARPET